MPGRLTGKSVIVTDQNAYSGPGIVDLFREEGAEVHATTRPIPSREAAEEFVAEVGRVDILIANHAVPFEPAPAVTGTDDEMQRIMEGVFYPMHRMIRAVLPQMLERGRGKIVITGSASALRGREGGVALYAAARGAQISYMHNLALEVAPQINVNATAQTYVDNPTYFPAEYQQTQDFRDRLAEAPAKRLASMRECAQTVLFLAGPESDFFYGQVVPFAGGWTV
ncbi:SDR family NAD(P)-dependent oxidoreductase [Streptomyces sp. NPDC058232]|uniref:SDR family NAD(P)-dependent oxidoreductase n=1 Tax=Streptomyces sp. NPDC058232 TaxID=3346393 RepID=UPI0036EB09B0